MGIRVFWYVFCKSIIRGQLHLNTDTQKSKLFNGGYLFFDALPKCEI